VDYIIIFVEVVYRGLLLVDV